MVVGQFGLSVPDLLGRFDGHDRRGRRPAHLRPVRLRRGDQPRQRLARGDADLPRRAAWSAGPRCSATCPTSAARRRRSMPTDARTIFEEGVVIPPFKLYRKGVLNEDALRIILNQVRDAGLEPRGPQRHRGRLPHRRPARAGDVRSGSAPRPTSRRSTRCCDRNYRAMKTLLDDGLRGRRDALVHRLHLRRRRRLRALRAEAVADPHRRQGASSTSPAASPQARGPVNYYINENLVRMFFGIYMITVADPQILWNDGFYPLVDVDHPGRLVLEAEAPGRAERPQPRHRAGLRPVRRAARARPTRPCSTRPASPPRRTSCTPGNYSSGDRKGEWFQLYSIGFGGIPGRPLGDGPDGHSLWPSFVNIPCEYLESYYPMRIERWETVTDTGGAGLHRGGNGVDVAYRFLEPGTIAIHDDRWLTYPWGVNGGEPGARGRKWLERADGTTEVLPSKVHDVPVAARRRAALRHLGRRRLGRPAGARPRTGRPGGAARAGHRRRCPPLRRGGRAGRRAWTRRRPRTLRARCAPDRPAELPIFDMGPPLATILERCLEETGLPAPDRPVAAVSGPATRRADELAANYARRVRRSPGLGQRPALVLVDLIRGLLRAGRGVLHGLDDACLASAPGVLAAARAAGRAGDVHPGRRTTADGVDGGLFVRKIPALRQLVAGGPLGEIMPQIAPRASTRS